MKTRRIKKTKEKTKIQNEKPKLKPQEKIDIIIYLYKYRFLNTRHIETILNKKYRQKVIGWLNDLSNKKFIKKDWEPKFPGEAAVYSLGVKGRKYFLEHPEIKDINYSVLGMVWRKYGKRFKNHCMLVGQIFITLRNLVKSVDKGRGKLRFYTRVDLKGVQYMINKEPDALFSIEDKNGLIKRYFLEIIDPYAAWKKTKYRIGKYFWYFDQNIWQNGMKYPFPEIIIVCPSAEYKGYVNSLIKKKLKETEANMLFYLSTWDEIQHQGVIPQVLHKVE